MGNWTDRFDPETVDEIKRYEVGEGDFLLAERLAMHKGVESVFGFHVNCLGLGKPYWEKGVYLGDVLDFLYDGLRLHGLGDRYEQHLL